MADRPRGNGGPEEGTPEYNWLYGNKGAGSSPGGRRHPRRAPAAPRRRDPRDAGVRGRRPPRPRAAAAGRPRPRSPHRRAGSAKTRPRRPVPDSPAALDLAAAPAWIVYLVAVPLYAWTKVEKVDFEPKGAAARRPAGYDVPPGRQRLARRPRKEERKELGTGNAAGQRTDTIMLLHTGDGPNLLMSIPRDSLVEIPGTAPPRSTPPTRTAAPKLLVETIEQTPASGSTTTSRSASAASSTWSTRSAASRSARRRA